MRDVDDDLIRRGGVILVDSKEACQKEAGELINAGLESKDLIELGDVLGDKDDDLRGRVDASGDVTIFKSVSFVPQLSWVQAWSSSELR
jgi:ornithine cyclodeaminase